MRLVKVGAAVLNQTPFDWDKNKQNIIDSIAAARSQGVSILCLPELCLTGYGCEDDFFRTEMQKRAWSELNQIAQESRGIIVSIGLPVFFANSLFNCSVLIADGKIVGISPKKSLAGDGIHYEPRWFEAWKEDLCIEADIYGTKLPMGDFNYDISGIKIGFEICEEAWVGLRPGGKLSARAVDIILNPSASHFSFRKIETRKQLVLEGSRAFGGTYVYTNLLGNEAGRAIYDGGAIIAQSGHLLALGPRLSFTDWQLTTAVIDVDLSRMRQARTFSFRPDLDALKKYAAVELSFPFPERLPEPVKPSTYDSWERSRNIKDEEFSRTVALGLFDYLRKSKSRGFAVSLSGGADSAAVSALVSLMVELAVSELGLTGFISRLDYIPELATAKNTRDLVHKLLLCAYQGSSNSSELTRNAAKTVAEAIGAQFYDLDIDPILKQYNKLAEQVLGRNLDWSKDDIAMQNIQARVRSPGIWFLANLFGMILLCTSNRSEGAVGYCTMDGDTSGGLSPVAGIDKNYLRRWLRWLETEGPAGLHPIPEMKVITSQQPTAELRPQSMHQTDESDLMPYDVLEEIEGAAIEDNRSPMECFKLLRSKEEFSQYDGKQIAAWVEKFFKLWSMNQWKRERLAPALHVASRNLDPRTWRRSPILSGNFRREIEDMWNYCQNEELLSAGRKRRVLIRVDIQNDFLPGGSLAVPKGDEVIAVVNRLSAELDFDLEVDTQDYHPEKHCSFQRFPPHCVAGTRGAEFHTGLVRNKSARVFRKATQANSDSFSGFGNQELEPFLHSASIQEVFVVGLALDYCVKETALDAKKAGFDTFVVVDACRSVDTVNGGEAAAVDEMKSAGIVLLNSSDLLSKKPAFQKS